MIFAISLRSCTERHGDFSESVVFHSSYEVSWWFFGLFVFFGLLFCLCMVCCLCCWMGDTLVPVSLYSHAWELTI